jgi:hypothetical protein
LNLKKEKRQNLPFDLVTRDLRDKGNKLAMIVNLLS